MGSLASSSFSGCSFCSLRTSLDRLNVWNHRLNPAAPAIDGLDCGLQAVVGNGDSLFGSNMFAGLRPDNDQREHPFVVAAGSRRADTHGMSVPLKDGAIIVVSSTSSPERFQPHSRLLSGLESDFH